MIEFKVSYVNGELYCYQGRPQRELLLVTKICIILLTSLNVYCFIFGINIRTDQASMIPRIGY